MESKTKNILLIATIVVLLMLSTPATAALEKLIMKLEEDNQAALTAYDDGTGTPTIGFGSTYNYDLNRPVQFGDQITMQQAYKFMRCELDQVVSDIKAFVFVPINNNQLYALASLGYNIGTPRLRTSTLIKLLNQGENKNFVADQFLVWNKAINENTGKLEFNQGLYNRRILERDLFLS